MALFSTLAGKSKTEVVSSSSTSSKSLDLSTVVQLFTDHPFPLYIDTAVPSTPGHHHHPSTPPSYAALHYTAVQCQTAAQLVETSLEQHRGGLRQLAKKTTTVATPDLGVWNFRVALSALRTSINNSSSSGALATTTTSTTTNPSASDTSLLSMITEKVSGRSLRTFCMAVDLSVLEDVEPSITRMQEALVRYLITLDPKTINSDNDVSDDGTVYTTSLYQLRKVQFGLGPNDDKSANAMSQTEPDPSERQTTIALQICVKLPSNASDFQEYRDQQAISLLVYHLRRYAAALSATLLFVSGATSSNDRSFSKDGTAGSDLALSPSKSSDIAESPSFILLQEQPSVPVQQLPIVWRELALGKAVWKSEECPDIYEDLDIEMENMNEEPVGDDASPDDAAVSAHSLIYGPGAHNEELIESVLLRNAHYPGHWDAAKDSVWKILPKENEFNNSDHTSGTFASKKKGGQHQTKGDDWWLTELRESIAIPDAMKTPPPKKSSDSAPSNTKTPNDAAVSSFFEDLLK